jgi:hypothetical protein
MLRFSILEVDNDYHAISGREVKGFATREQADVWCREKSWTGYHYFVEHQIEEPAS